MYVSVLRSKVILTLLPMLLGVFGGCSGEGLSRGEGDGLSIVPAPAALIGSQCLGNGDVWLAVDTDVVDDETVATFSNCQIAALDVFVVGVNGLCRAVIDGRDLGRAADAFKDPDQDGEPRLAAGHSFEVEITAESGDECEIQFGLNFDGETQLATFVYPAL